MPTKLHSEAKIKIEVACAITNFKENDSLNTCFDLKGRSDFSFYILSS